MCSFTHCVTEAPTPKEPMGPDKSENDYAYHFARASARASARTSASFANCAFAGRIPLEVKLFCIVPCWQQQLPTFSVYIGIITARLLVLELLAGGNNHADDHTDQPSDLQHMYRPILLTTDRNHNGL